MNALEQAIEQAYVEPKNQLVNKVHLEFLKANFIVPIEKMSEKTEPKVLFYSDDDKVFLPVFNDEACLQQWAYDIEDDIALLRLSGIDLLKGLGPETYVSLNIGSKLYKEFHPDELAKLKLIVAKFFNK